MGYVIVFILGTFIGCAIMALCAASKCDECHRCKDGEL